MPELSYDQLVEMRTTRLAQLYNDGTGDAWLMAIDTALSVGKERDAAVATSLELLIEVDRWGQAAHEAGAERDAALTELRAVRKRVREMLENARCPHDPPHGVRWCSVLLPEEVEKALAP